MTPEERAIDVLDQGPLDVNLYNSIVAHIREACAEAVAEALREGMRDAPIIPAHLHAIRETADWVKGRAAAATFDIHDLFRVIDHQAARIAALANDSGQWQDGYRAGKADTEDRPWNFGIVPRVRQGEGHS